MSQLVKEIGCCNCGAAVWKRVFEKQNFNFVKCRSCGLLRLDPLPSEQQLDKHYANRAVSGNYESTTDVEYQNTNLHLFNFISKRTGGRLSKIFDIGCFRGEFLDVAKTAGSETWGMELQPNAVQHANKNHEGRVFNSSIDHFSPKDSGLSNDFDVVLAAGVIEHLRQPEKIFEHASYLLKDGGYLVIQTPNYSSIVARLMGKFWPCIAAPEHVYYFGRAHIRGMAERWDFNEVACRPHWKTLRVGFVVNQFQYFGPEIYKLIRPVSSRLPKMILNIKLPFYGGEMIMVLRMKTSRP